MEGIVTIVNRRGSASQTPERGPNNRQYPVPAWLIAANIGLTAPYMHDGRFATLKEVVAHYTMGVKHSATLDPNLAKHPDGGVPLSAEDQRALVAFLRTLTEERFIY